MASIETIPITEAKARIAELARISRPETRSRPMRSLPNWIGVATEPSDGGGRHQPGRCEPIPSDLFSRARRNLHEGLPSKVAVAATETIRHAIANNLYREGKPLDEPFDGYHSARRGTYRIVYRIDEPKRVEIHSIRHRRNLYRV